MRAHAAAVYAVAALAVAARCTPRPPPPHRLYYLLGERTRADHLDMERKVRNAREKKSHAAEDHATLTQHMHDMRAAKEDAERQLQHMRRMLEDAKRDWVRKMRDRKKEVAELKRRQEREEAREQKRCVGPGPVRRSPLRRAPQFRSPQCTAGAVRAGSNGRRRTWRASSSA